ncbi:hypothetical protein K488DRAFT_76135 [Vararia minispora EC-137]|uniref:Uncharacterized protein n=1 Tax=Vararia minispora EC-137 TaxID=1314806 RepID=A0ACB8QWQ4_9AGAM|nr:hypothetical protein K488DRAFT_76135 [Vararia minispora EC-137]
MVQPIVLYDLKCKVPEGLEYAWSPNGWRTRLALNYKNLPYTTKWVGYADVEATVKKLGVAPHAPGSFLDLKYTVPAIYDPNARHAVMDSHQINRYLDEQYPETPQVFPEGTRALQAAFCETNQRILGAMFPAILDEVFDKCGDKDKEYFRESREAYFGAKLETVAPKGKAFDAKVEELERILREIGDWIDANGHGAVFIGGEAPVHADFDTVAQFIFLIKTVPEDHAMRRMFDRTDGGRWPRYLQAFSKWTERST